MEHSNYQDDIVIKQNDIKWVVIYRPHKIMFIGFYETEINDHWAYDDIGYRGVYGQLLKLAGGNLEFFKLFDKYSKGNLKHNEGVIIFPNINDRNKKISVTYTVNDNTKHIDIEFWKTPKNEMEMQIYMLVYGNAVSAHQINALTNEVKILKEENAQINDKFAILTDFIDMINNDGNKLTKVKKIIQNRDN